MKLHRAFGNVEPGCNLLIREPLENALEHILLPTADLHARTDGTPRREQLLGAFRNHIQQRTSGDNHQLIILGCVAPHQTVNREQTCDFFDGHTSIRVGFHAEPHGSRGTLT